MPEQTKPTQEERMWAVIGYLWALSIVVVLLRRNKFVHDHAKQGLLLFIGEILVFIPVFGWLIFLVSILLALVGIIKAWNGEDWKVPFIGEKWDKAVKI